jgi:hypothetical protein
MAARVAETLKHLNERVRLHVEDINQVNNHTLPMRDQFEQDGFLFVPGAQMRSILPGEAAAWLQLATVVARSAPIDSNPGGDVARRHRYYSISFYVPRAPIGSRLVHVPALENADGHRFTTYLQPPGANSEYEAERRFVPLPDQLLSHPGLAELVDISMRFCPRSLFGDTAPPFYKIGFHLIALKPDGLHPGWSSPRRAHFDGEYVTSIWLLEREGVIGGASLIAERKYSDWHPDDVPPEAKLLEHVLSAPLDMLCADDRRVSHYVGPVYAKRNGEGVRSVLLLDITPMTAGDSEARLKSE